MRMRSCEVWVVASLAALMGGVEAVGPAGRVIGPRPSSAVDLAAAERGRVALTLEGLLEARVVRQGLCRCGTDFGASPPRIPTRSPPGYAAAFRHRYGLHPAPYPNDGLPMGLRRGRGPRGAKTGIQLDCMLCHGGSIGGQSYVGLGNTQLDLKAVLFELTFADGKRPPFSTFVLNSSRGTNNAGQIAAVLLSLRNTDLSIRSFPLPLGVNLPEMDTPAWWHLKRKRTMYYDGRTDARSVRTNMQFLLGEKSLEELKELEPAFRDLQAFLKSLEPPKYPFAIDSAKAVRGHRGQRAVIRRQAPRAQDFVNRRYRHRGVVDQVERAKNRTKSKVRAKVEHPIGIIKRVFGFAKVRYRGLAKNAHRLVVTCALANLFMARRHLLRCPQG